MYFYKADHRHQLITNAPGSDGKYFLIQRLAAAPLDKLNLAAVFSLC